VPNNYSPSPLPARLRNAHPGMARIISMDTGTPKKYFAARSGELLKSCSDGNAWVFLCGSAMLEYLAKIVNGSDLKGEGYKRFIREYLADVRPAYRDFKYSLSQLSH
jgi:hypothetical protein